MGRFSDSPYFLLKDFFGGRGNIYDLTRPIIDWEWPVIWTDRDYVTFDDRQGVYWNLRYYYDANAATTDGSYLIGLETNIIARGDGLIDLWVKETDEPEKQFLPVTLRWDRLEDNTFYFTDSDLCNLSASTFTHHVTGARFGMDWPDRNCQGFDELINNNRETYFRKDSIYHEWLTKIAPGYYNSDVSVGGRGQETDIRNYTNTDMIWSYFGKIYKKRQTDDYAYRIIFDGLKKFSMQAIPEHQRTPNFKKFMEIFLDQKWHETYNQIKNIWTLFDPMEIDEDFLGYLSQYYHMFDLLSPTLFRQREFVRDLIWLLKRKGTYVEFYIIWRAVANTINALNIYEKWHDRDIILRVDETPDTHVQEDEFEEYIYVEKPEYRFSAPIGGADVGWYNRTYGLSGESIVSSIAPSGFYNYPVKLDANPEKDEYGMSNKAIPLPVYGIEDDRILSTHYKVEIDVSSEPLLPDAIVNKVMWDELWQYWEYLRPINRVVDYNILIAPITDFSGQFISLYGTSPDAFDLTKVQVGLRLPDGWIEPFTEELSGCLAYHSLPLSAQALTSPSGCNWIIDHDLNTKYLHTMAVDLDFNQIIPKEIEIVSNSRVIMHWDTPVTGYGILKKSQTFGKGGTTLDIPWRIYHYRQHKEIILEVHNDDLKIFSNDVHLSDINYATLDTADLVDNTVPASSGAFIFIQDTPTKSWEIPHELYYRGVILSVYDFNDNQIVQYDLNLTAIDRCTLDFDMPVAGYAVLIPVANFSMADLISEFRNILRNGADWRGAETIGDLSSGTFAASGTILQNEIYEDDEFFYINIKLGKEIEGSFKEFGIYDSNGKLIVYSKSSEIYKPAGTTLVLHFRIEKTAGGIINTL